MSASKMREAAMNNDYKEFKKGHPDDYDGTILFEDVKKNMEV